MYLVSIGQIIKSNMSQTGFISALPVVEGSLKLKLYIFLVKCKPEFINVV